MEGEEEEMEKLDDDQADVWTNVGQKEEYPGGTGTGDETTNEAPVAGPSVEELQAQLAEAMKKYQALLDKEEAAAKRRQEEG